MDESTQIVPSVEAPPAPLPPVPGAAAAALTPPTSEENDKREERMSSELTDIDSDDGEEIEPDHYFEGGKVPVFKPVGGTPAVCMMRRQARGLTCTIADHGSIPQLPALHRQD